MIKNESATADLPDNDELIGSSQSRAHVFRVAPRCSLRREADRLRAVVVPAGHVALPEGVAGNDVELVPHPRPGDH